MLQFCEKLSTESNVKWRIKSTDRSAMTHQSHPAFTLGHGLPFEKILDYIFIMFKHKNLLDSVQVISLVQKFEFSGSDTASIPGKLVQVFTKFQFPGHELDRSSGKLIHQKLMTKLIQFCFQNQVMSQSVYYWKMHPDINRYS